MGDSSPLATNKASKFMQGRKTLTERGILTVSAIQANAAAGGLALATCCDITLCSANAVLNPHYRGVGLFGSEFHRYHWTTRMGEAKCQETMSKMLPISPRRALSLGLVDKIVGDRESSPDEIEASIKQYIGQLSKARAGEISAHGTAPWVRSRTGGLPSCASPFDSLISTLVKAKRLTHQTFKVPLVWYRNEELSQMLLDFYHPVRSDRYHTRRRAFVRKFVGKTTPLRFAEHNRTGIDGHLKLDPEEEAEFDTAPGWTRGEEWRWAGQMVPEGFLSHKGLIDSSGTKQSEEQTEHTSLPASVQSRDLALSQVSPSIVDRPGIASSDPVITAIDRQNNLLQDVLNILAVSNSGVQPAGLPNRSSEPIPRTPAKSRPLSFQPATANGNTPQPRHSHDPHSTIRGWNSLVNAQRSPPIPVEIASDPKNPSTIRSTLSRFMSTARGRKSQTNVFQTKDLPQPNEDHSARGSCETTGRSSGRPSQSIKGKDVPPMLYPCYYLAEEDRAA
jgi:enoyl-CoA hydratase/carnithine racemase